MLRKIKSEDVILMDGRPSDCNLARPIRKLTSLKGKQRLLIISQRTMMIRINLTTSVNISFNLFQGFPVHSGISQGLHLTFKCLMPDLIILLYYYK